MNVRYIVTIFSVLCIGSGIMAQGKLVDRRDQAEGWYVPIHGQVMAEGKKVKDVKMIVYRENREIGQFQGKRNGRFELELDIDQTYTIRVIRKGYQEKLVVVDTSLPKDLVVYPDYHCNIEMRPVNVQNIDPFYSDFPSAIIRFNNEKGGFYHSETYLIHIQTKLAGYARANF